MLEPESHTTADPLDAIPQSAAGLISPFIKRGKELHKVQPLISYYCYLYSAQLILESKLHMQDAEVAEYIEVLLNYIESIKKEIDLNNLTDIVNDKTKSFKLILGFSLSIFNKSINEINNHTSSVKTVINFKAFLDFIQILKLWPELYADQAEDIQNQIKYAKFHSSRILKDIKANKDPNDYITPQNESELSEFIAEPPSQQSDATEPPQFVSDNESDDNMVLPKPPSSIPGDLKMPTAPVLIKGQKNSLGLPAAPSDDEEEEIAPPVIPAKPSTIPTKPVIKHTPVVVAQPAVGESKILSKADVEQIWSNSEIISNAQRKAKFAISALNYDDIETAITELQGALKLLRGE